MNSAIAGQKGWRAIASPKTVPAAPQFAGETVQASAGTSSLTVCVLGGAGIQKRSRVSFARAAWLCFSRSRAAASASRSVLTSVCCSSASRASRSRCVPSAAANAAASTGCRCTCEPAGCAAAKRLAAAASRSASPRRSRSTRTFASLVAASRRARASRPAANRSGAGSSRRCSISICANSRPRAWTCARPSICCMLSARSSFALRSASSSADTRSSAFAPSATCADNLAFSAAMLLATSGCWAKLAPASAIRTEAVDTRRGTNRETLIERRHSR